MIQLGDYKEMERMAYISADELDYSAQSDLEGVNQVSLGCFTFSCRYFFSSSNYFAR
jgi:hypothetical protein